jgi:hypothetical protein
MKTPPRKKAALFQSRTASREAVIKNDQERICDKVIVVLKRSRYFLSPSDLAGGLPRGRKLLRERGTTKNNP